MKVAVLGASADPGRYSYLAVERLRAQGHEVIGVSPKLPELGPVPVVATVSELPGDVHTLTVYVSPKLSTAMADAVLSQGFSRVVFNPGSENPPLAERLAERGVEVLEACTLVLLATKHFG